MKKIYLASSLNFDSWKITVNNSLSMVDFELIDPVLLEDDGVLDDIKSVLDCDIILANLGEQTIGTIFEIMYGFMFKKKVYVVGDINSPWLQYHATKVFDNLNDAIEEIKLES